MLASSVSINRFNCDIYMKDISDTKYQLHNLHLEKYCIQQKIDKNFQH